MASTTRNGDPDAKLQQRLPRPHTGQSDLSDERPTSKQQDDTPFNDSASMAGSSIKSPTQGAHRRFVLTDPVAFRYLEEDPSTQVLQRQTRLQGYESYLVEQWACSRTHPTFIITTFTGDPADSVSAHVLSVPTDEATWSPQLRIYFKALKQYHARERETNLGTLMITNLSGFPSSLTVIPIPNGDIKGHRELFFVNENLKRLGCSGRVGIKLAPPSSATEAKFHQLYRTSDKIPLNGAVIELVKLCQVALVLFGKLEPEYADGLLCDITEKAVNDWWVEFGTEYYNIEAHDGILGPTTVAALLGMLMGARNRLSAYNAPVAKDVFDAESTKRGIAYFQKTQRLQKTRRLDRQTLERLRRATAKAASGEEWALPRAVKSTVAELSGKGGEMVMGMVGGRDKGGIADIETVDIDRFVELVQGERSKWLWYGKPRKTKSDDIFSRLPENESGMVFHTDEQGNYTWSGRKKDSVDEHNLRRRETKEEAKHKSDSPSILEGFEKDPFSKRGALRKATDKLEARSGFSRIKDVVRNRNHQSKPSKDETPRHMHSSKGDHGQPPETADTADGSAQTDFATLNNHSNGHVIAKVLTETPHESESTLVREKGVTSHADGKPEVAAAIKPEHDEVSLAPTITNSIAGSIYKGIDLKDILPTDEFDDIGIPLRRRQSAEELMPYHKDTRNDDWWPRRLSFSVAEESILTWRSIPSDMKEDLDAMASAKVALDRLKATAEDARCMRERLALLSNIDGTWVDEGISNVRFLRELVDQDIQALEDMYYPRYDEYHTLQEDAQQIFTRERSLLQDTVKDLETLGAKLEYEINALRGKVEDVEDGVAEFEKQVIGVEERVEELENTARRREGWGHWLLRVTIGIGQAPTPATR